MNLRSTEELLSQEMFVVGLMNREDMGPMTSFVFAGRVKTVSRKGTRGADATTSHLIMSRYGLSVNNAGGKNF